MSLRVQTFSGVRWTTVSSFGRALLQVTQLAILTRLLTPADFGLVAVVAAIVAILQIFSDAGVSNAIIHYQDITESEMSGLYWLNIGISSFLALLVALLSTWLGVWYHQPKLRGLLLIGAMTLVAGAVGQQARVVAQKHLRFSDLAKVELAGAIAGSVAAISLALLGWGALSLVVGSFITAAITSLMACVYLSVGWRPPTLVPVGEISRFIRFGLFIMGNNLANALNSQIDVLLGGRLLGAYAIGFYSVPRDFASRLAAVINPVVTEVSLPVMAKAQGDRLILKKIYLQMLRMIASVSFPIYVALSIFAGEVVHILFGEQWQPTVPLLRLLACWALLRSISNPVGSLLIALGRPGLSLTWNAALLCVMPPTIWLGAKFGAIGLATVLTLLAAVLYVPNWYFLVRPLSGAGLGEYAAQVAVPLGSALFAGFAGYICAEPFRGDYPRLVVGGLVGGLVYLMCSSVFNRPWINAMKELLSTRLSMRWTS